MIKKYLIILITILSFFSFNNINVYSSGTWITGTWFMIDTNSIFVWNKSFYKWSNSDERVNFLLWTIISKLMIWLSILALVIMTIWAWFMILWSWDDQNISKWKYMLKAGIISLVIALSAYQIISLLRFILYK